jgi:hypothetical protein
LGPTNERVASLKREYRASGCISPFPITGGAIWIPGAEFAQMLWHVVVIKFERKTDISLLRVRKEWNMQ